MIEEESARQTERQRGGRRKERVAECREQALYRLKEDTYVGGQKDGLRWGTQVIIYQESALSVMARTAVWLAGSDQDPHPGFSAVLAMCAPKGNRR